MKRTFKYGKYNRNDSRKSTCLQKRMKMMNSHKAFVGERKTVLLGKNSTEPCENMETKFLRKSPRLSGKTVENEAANGLVHVSVGEKRNETQLSDQNVFSDCKEMNNILSNTIIKTETLPQNAPKSESTSSPKQTVRRKIMFKSFDETDADTNDESEIVVPRRKKLRSEMTEDELWEGFPQIVRFKRLTPQKNHLKRGLRATSGSNITNDVLSEANNGDKHEENKITFDKSKGNAHVAFTRDKTTETLFSQSRAIANIFTDFSKVVSDNDSSSSTHDLKCSQSLSTRKRGVITPKRSARLQEKRESPVVKKDNDFVYTPLKRNDSKNDVFLEQFKVDVDDSKRVMVQRHENKSSLLDGIQCDITSNDRNKNTRSNNETMKQLYKSTVIHNLEGREYNRGIEQTEINGIIEVMNISMILQVDNSQQQLRNLDGNRRENGLTSCTEDTTNIELESIKDYKTSEENAPVNSSENQNHVDTRQFETFREKNDFQNSPSVSSFSLTKVDAMQQDQIKFHHKKIANSENEINTALPTSQNETNRQTVIKPLDAAQEQEGNNEARAYYSKVKRGVPDKKAKKTPALKLRLRKKDDGAEIIYSGTSEDHAYVLSTPRGRKLSTGNDSNNAKCNRKRTLQVEAGGIAKRRSPRVANASSVGKGPGMAEQCGTNSIEDNNSSTVSTVLGSKSTTKLEKGKKVSDEEHLLKNTRIGKYACMLWSSENKRNFQQLHPESTADEVDNLMRTAWENLENRDKLRYFTRASNATRDENKHSASVLAESTETMEQRTPCPYMAKFLSTSSEEQDAELKRWLKFFYEVSPNEYAKLKILEKPKLRKDEWKSKENKADPLQYYRKVLYQSILDSKVKIMEIYERKKQRQQEMVKDAFGAIVKQLITGKSIEELSFSRDITSKRLAEVLLDLQYLENERKIGVSGAQLTSKSYETLVEDLKINDDNGIAGEIKEGESNDSVEFDIAVGNEFSQELLDKVADTDLPLLEVDSVTEILKCQKEIDDDFMFSSDVFEQLSSIFEQQAKKELVSSKDQSENPEIRNPANILNSWVLADQFKTLAKSTNPRSYNSVYSLVDRKHLVPFLHGEDPSKERKRGQTSSEKPDISNNNSNKQKPERESYQAKIDRLSYQRPPLPSVRAVPGICMVEPSDMRYQRPQLSQILPAVPMQSQLGMTTHGQTFVKFTSHPGRCRIFSVRQAR